MEDQEFRSKIKAPGKYSVAFKRKVVNEYSKGLLNKAQLRAKYDIGGKSIILLWCQKYGNLQYKEKTTVGRPMKDSQKQRIKDLEKRLKEAEFKVVAYEKLIEIAEREEGISILKKDDAKRSVSLPKSTREP
jgi:hypothetical protein